LPQLMIRPASPSGCIMGAIASIIEHHISKNRKK
jgi:hypothetical protein